jgi:hypothetical protein
LTVEGTRQAAEPIAARRERICIVQNFVELNEDDMGAIAGGEGQVRAFPEVPLQPRIASVEESASLRSAV